MPEMAITASEGMSFRVLQFFSLYASGLTITPNWNTVSTVDTSPRRAVARAESPWGRGSTCRSHARSGSGRGLVHDRGARHSGGGRGEIAAQPRESKGTLHFRLSSRSRAEREPHLRHENSLRRGVVCVFTSWGRSGRRKMQRTRASRSGSVLPPRMPLRRSRQRPRRPMETWARSRAC